MEETSAIMKGVDWELYFFLRAFFLGFCLRMGYDLFLIFRKICRHRHFWVNAEDFLFWMTGSILMFGLLFQENSGTPRFFALLGVMAGMILYHMGPSPLCLGIFEVLRKTIRKMKKIVEKRFNALLQKTAKGSRMNNKGNKCLQEAVVEEITRSDKGGGQDSVKK